MNQKIFQNIEIIPTLVQGLVRVCNVLEVVDEGKAGMFFLLIRGSNLAGAFLFPSSRDERNQENLENIKLIPLWLRKCAK